MKDKLSGVLTLLFVLAMILAPIAWTVFQWRLCRAEGFGIWYCIQHIG